MEKNNNATENNDDRWFETIRKIRDYAEEQYDRLIVYLNSGALIITVGFVKDIVKITSDTETNLLKTSWVFFTASLLFILVSHRTAIIAMDYELKEKEKVSRRWDKVTRVFNWTSLLFLIVGIICFLIFVSKEI